MGREGVVGDTGRDGLFPLERPGNGGVGEKEVFEDNLEELEGLCQLGKEGKSAHRRDEAKKERICRARVWSGRGEGSVSWGQRGKTGCAMLSHLQCSQYSVLSHKVGGLILYAFKIL